MAHYVGTDGRFTTKMCLLGDLGFVLRLESKVLFMQVSDLPMEYGNEFKQLMFSSACYFERSNNHSNSLHLIFLIFGFIKSLPIRQTPQLQIGFKFKHSFVLQYDGTLVL